MARLPIVGGDEDNWGNLLNEFLGVSHNGDGTLRFRAHRSGTFKVAASNSRTEEKELADYVCDGMADEIEINNALIAAGEAAHEAQQSGLPALSEVCKLYHLDHLVGTVWLQLLHPHRHCPHPHSPHYSNRCSQERP